MERSKQSVRLLTTAILLLLVLCAVLIGADIRSRANAADGGELPLPADSNANLLDLPDYANKAVTYVSATPASGLEINGTDLTVSVPENANYFVTNSYISGGEFYRTDIDEYSDGSDLDWLAEADVTITDYGSSPQAWYGMGIILGDTQQGSLAVRFMQSGVAFLGDFRKSDNQTLYNVDKEPFVGGFDKGNTFHVKAYYLSGTITLCVDDKEVITREPVVMTPALGVHTLNAAGRVENYSFKFIPPVSVPAAQPQSQETAEFSFSDGRLASGKADSAIEGTLESFAVTVGASEDYWLMNSSASALDKLYIMTGAETADEYDNATLSTCITATLKDITLSDGGYVLFVLRQGSGRVRLQLRIDSNGIELQTATNSNAVTVGEYAFDALPDSLQLRVICAETNSTVVVNGVAAIRAASYNAPYSNQIGFGGKNATYTVDDVSYKYYDDVRLSAPIKETFPQKPPVGDANTDYIAPVLPSPMPTDDSAESGCGSVAGVSCALGSVIAFAAAMLTIFVRRRKENEKIR